MAEAAVERGGGLSTLEHSGLLDYLRHALGADATLLTWRDGPRERCVAVSAASSTLRALTGETFAADLPGGNSTTTPIHDRLGRRLGSLVCLRHRQPARDGVQRPTLLRTAAMLLAAAPPLALPKAGPPITGPVAMTTVLQPIVDLDTGHVVGAEALSRFDGDPPPDPGDVFALAAAARASEQIELAAVVSALATLPLLPARVRLYLNVSPSVATSPALQPLLAAAGPHRLVLELTEYDTTDPGAVVDALAPLRARGLQVAVDDLGTGNAHLQRLIALRPEVVKLDRSLTTQVEADPYRQALVRALVSFSNDTASRLVAEGVETGRQVRALRRMGVRFGQGYHLGFPAVPERLFPATVASPGGALAGVAAAG